MRGASRATPHFEDARAVVSVLQERGFVEVHKEFVEKLPRTLVSLTESGRAALLEYRRIFQQVLETIPAGPKAS